MSDGGRLWTVGDRVRLAWLAGKVVDIGSGGDTRVEFDDGIDSWIDEDCLVAEQPPSDFGDDPPPMAEQLRYLVLENRDLKRDMGKLDEANEALGAALGALRAVLLHPPAGASDAEVLAAARALMRGSRTPTVASGCGNYDSEHTYERCIAGQVAAGALPPTE